MQPIRILGYCIVVSLLICPLVVGWTAISTEESIAELSGGEWVYGDYRPATKVSSASGSLEIAEQNGVRMVHAAGVGEGSFTMENGRTSTVYVGKAPLDVWMIFGQSNASYYRFSQDHADPVARPGTCFFYGAANGPLDIFGPAAVNRGEFDPTFAPYGMHDMMNLDGTAVIGNWDLPLASMMAEHTGHKIYIVNAGIPGTPIRYFNPGVEGDENNPEGSVYAYAKGLYNAAIALADPDLFDVTVKSYFWIQGGRDPTLTVERYIEIFTLMHNALTTAGDFTEVPFEACYISQERWQVAAVQAEAQLILAETIPTVHMATRIANTFTIENGLMLDDGRHYSQAGDNLIAAAFFDYIYGD